MTSNKFDKLFNEAFPKLPEELEEKLKREVLQLFGKARWHTGKIAKWMASPASGYGHYFTEEEAHDKIIPWCRELNNIRKAAHQNVNRVFRAAGF